MNHVHTHHHYNSSRKAEYIVDLYPFRDYLATAVPEDKPRRSFWKLLNSSLPFYILRWLVIFFVNAGIWVLLFEKGVLGEPGERVLLFSTSLDLIGFALGLIYWMWVSQGRERMFRKAEIYVDLLDRAESLARRIVNSLENKSSEEADSGKAKKKQVASPPSPYALGSTIEEIQVLLCADVNAFTYVMLNDPLNMQCPKTHSAEDLSLTPLLKEELDGYTPSDEIEMAQYLGVMMEKRLKRLADWKQLSSGVYSFNEIEEMSKVLRTLRTNKEEQSYEYVNLFMICALTIVLFFFPYVIWPHARIYTLIVYPVLMFIIAGLPLTISWYGDPFEGRPGDNAIHYRYKECVSCNRIYESFQGYFKERGTTAAVGTTPVHF